MYAKKFTSFCQVLNKIQTKENWFLFSASRCTDTQPHTSWLSTPEKHFYSHQASLQFFTDTLLNNKLVTTSVAIAGI